MSDMEPERIDPLQQRLQQLRHEFDSAFARPVVERVADADTLVCFTADGGRFAIRSTGLQAFTRAGSIVPVPSRAPALVGLTVVRARLVPVYSLGRLMDASSIAVNPSWLAVLRGAEAVALGLDSLDGYAEQNAVAQEAGGASPRFAAGSVRHGNQLYALLDSQQLYEAITGGTAAQKKGQD
jgi:chemotaxis signal transduction protein